MSEICVDACAYYRKSGKCSIPHYANGVKFTGCNCADWECSFKSWQKTSTENDFLRTKYCEYSDKISVLEAELERYKKYKELEKFLENHDTSNEKQIAQKLFEAEQRIKSLENAQRLAIENITKVVKALNVEE